jgi:UDP-N-acetylglucosamine:LPS N-acetylglucosamine transferase
MNILFSAGGTLGHINPALSFIKALKNYYNDIKITFIATYKEKNLEILKTNLIDDIYYIESYGRIDPKNCSNSAAIRPVIYISKDVMFNGGKGTEEEPYIIK